jgi:hypothetical protein
MTIRNFVLGCFFAATACGEPVPMDLDLVGDDGTCSGYENECSLSLRQLRAKTSAFETTPEPSKVVDDVEPVTAATDPQEASEFDTSVALPGGWGEAAEAVESTNTEALAAWRRRPVVAWHPPRGNVLTLYHQTGGGSGPLILRGGFRPGSTGWCGGGIYFATSPQATETKAIGPQSHKGFMIEARVNIGRVKDMPRTCDRGMNAGRIHAMGFDSIRFNPGDGTEYVVYSPANVLSVRSIPWR